MNEPKKISYADLLLVLIALFVISIPITMLYGKYSVCRNYFPELNSYVCMWTNLPPYTGVKK